MAAMCSVVIKTCSNVIGQYRSYYKQKPEHLTYSLCGYMHRSVYRDYFSLLHKSFLGPPIVCLLLI